MSFLQNNRNQMKLHPIMLIINLLLVVKYKKTENSKISITSNKLLNVSDSQH